MTRIPLTATDEDGNVITMCIDPGNASEKTLTDLLTALSKLHIAYGGSGLIFKVADSSNDPSES